MTIKERIKKLANSEGLSIPKLEEELGFGGGTISRWDKSAPSADKLSKIADRFDVTVDYLLGRELTKKDEKDIAKDMEQLREKLLNNEDGPASYDGESIPVQDAELLLGQIELMMKLLKPINKEKYNPNKNKK